MSTSNSTEFLFDRTSEKYRRNIVTPEGVLLPVDLAPLADRAGAFIIDFLICIGATLLMLLPVVLLPLVALPSGIVSALAFLIAFVVRAAYFVHFELVWRGTTPGKRITGLRVIDRRGGPLMPSAVIARNLTREFEVFMPLSVLMSIGNVDAGNVGQLLSAVWVLCIGVIPMINRDRMRGGDLIAGTVVIRMATRTLSKDIANADFHYTFTDQHLSAYGNFELLVLEELLRQYGEGLATQVLRGGSAAQAYRTAEEGKRMLREIGDKIRRKINWLDPVPPEQELQFLKDFYTAERAFLERGQLFGVVKADKHQERKRQEVPPTEREH